MKPISNQVLLKINIDNSIIRFENGQILWLDTTYNVGRHQSVNCEVVAVPDKLVYGDHLDFQQSMPHQTEMELKVGDEVIVRYLAIHDALGSKDPKHFTHENGEDVFFIKYEDIYVAKRNVSDWMNIAASGPKDKKAVKDLENDNVIWDKGKYYEIIPLNGWTLCEPLSVEIKTKLIIPDYLKKKADKKVCIATFVGSPNKSYWRTENYRDDPRLKSGAKVIVEKNCDIELEPKEHLTLYGDRYFWRIQRQNIIGIIQ
jgi:hypothetical protein